MAAYVELYLDQGTTFENTITLTDDLTNTAMNIYGYTVTSQMRRSYYSANITANILCSIANSSNGLITMSLPSANTANIKPGRYVFDIKAVNSGGITSRLLEGIITVTPQVTK